MNFEIEKFGKPYLFRYRKDNENTLSELRDNYIFFNSRDAFNDPFDANHNLLKITDNNESINNFKNEILSSINEPLTKKYFEKYSLDDLRNLISNNLETFISRYGIACFSNSLFNLPLWLIMQIIIKEYVYNIT